MISSFEFVLFHSTPDFTARAIDAGIQCIIVDWERKNKFMRQNGFDTQINEHTAADLIRLRKYSSSRILCRINGPGFWTADEVNVAVSEGADEILLPMVRSVNDVRAVLDAVQGKCQVGILIETVDALSILQELSSLPLSRVYVGLNDLHIELLQNTKGEGITIFSALASGKVDNIRGHFHQRFGFGGLTLPDKGHPLPCRLLMSEMVRLNCGFSFLRRSFFRDTEGMDLSVAVLSMKTAIEELQSGDIEKLMDNRHELCAIVHQLEPGYASNPADVSTQR